MRTPGFVISFLIPISLLIILAGSVSADSGENDSYEGAERVVEDTFSGSLVKDTDNDDWYIIEVPPFTDVKITVELMGPDIDDHIDITSFIQSGKEESSINMTLDRSLTKDDDTYSNDDSGFIDLYLHLNGKGSYEVEYLFERDLSGGLCGSSLFLLLLPIAVISMLVIRYRW